MRITDKKFFFKIFDKRTFFALMEQMLYFDFPFIKSHKNITFY